MMNPRSSFAGLPLPQSTGGVTIRERDGLGIATILARKGQAGALAERLQDRLGITLPQGATHSTAPGLRIAGTGPGAWIATHESAGNSFAASLAEMIGDLASVSDQSDGYAVVELSGYRVGEVLCRLVPIDVHPRVFKVGDVATTLSGHINVILWRLEDGPDALPRYQMALYRSFAESFASFVSEVVMGATPAK
jgi:heterotetrameric sarcosine oxidase gamma subunit